MSHSLASVHTDRTEAERKLCGSLIEVGGVAILIAYFLHFSLPAVHGGLREDEMGAMGLYWSAGVGKSLLANVVFWPLIYFPGHALYDLPLYLYRPGGALYYMPLYYVFGLNPVPYQITHVSILAASIPMVYYLSRCLAASRSIAFLATLAVCYHPRLAALVFINAYILDVLCGVFYLAAFTYYIHIRQREMPLRPLQLLVFLALYICALNFKEMAVTLPVIVLIYEVLKSPLRLGWKAFFQWTQSFAAPALMAGLLTALYIYGKTHGSGTLVGLDPYRPRFTWHNFVTSNSRFVGELFFTHQAIGPVTLLVLWAAVFAYAFVRRSRTLQLMAFWIVIVPLPIAFIPPRSSACLYLLLFGWAMIFATVTVDLITLISRSAILPRWTRRFGETTTAKTAQAREQTLSRLFRIAAIFLVTFAFAMFTERENQRLGVPRAKIGGWTSHYTQLFRSLNLHPLPGSSVLLLLRGNLFNNKWNAFFMASLIWNDRSLRLWVEDESELTQQQMANVDYIVSITRSEAKVIRRPETPQSN